MTKIAISAVFIIVVASFMYWLWQRQPRLQQLTAPTQTQQAQEASGQANQESLQIKPADTQVLSQNKITFEGKAKPNRIVLIYSNDFANTTSSDNNGNFTKTATLVNGLNFVSVVFLDNDPKQTQKQTLTYLVVNKADSQKTNVFAGSVKSIFDTVLALTWQQKDKTINVAKNAEIIMPKNPKEEKITPTVSPLSSIRLQDFVVGLGILDKNGQLSANSLEVIRENIPAISAQFAQIKIVTAISKNSFSAIDEATSENLTFVIDTNTEILLGEQKMQTKDITKDKKAIVVYHSEKNQNLVDSLFLLP